MQMIFFPKQRILKLLGCSILIGIFLALLIVPYICFPRWYSNVVEQYSAKYGVESALVFAVIRAESNFDETAVSRSGAVGLMQIMPATALFISQMLGESFNLNDPDDNIHMGVWYLHYLQSKFNRLDIILAAYNAGEGTVKIWMRDGCFDANGKSFAIPYPETEHYVKKVKIFYNCYKMLF